MNKETRRQYDTANRKLAEKFEAAPTYRRWNAYGFVRLFRDGQQIASTAIPGDEGTRYLDEIERAARAAIARATGKGAV